MRLFEILPNNFLNLDNVDQIIFEQKTARIEMKSGKQVKVTNPVRVEMLKRCKDRHQVSEPIRDESDTKSKE